MKVLILGSAPGVVAARDWARTPFDVIVAINNAWAVRPDWDVLIHPEDFPADRQPQGLRGGQRVVAAADYVPANSAFGGIVYAGGTMAFSAGYWVLHTLRPKVMAFFGCDMVYDGARTHFYGAGQADPLRADPTLQDLQAKSARLELLAARAGCAAVNLSMGPSRLSFPRATRAGLGAVRDRAVDAPTLERALTAEADLGCVVPSGRYWQAEGVEAAGLAQVDALWRQAWQAARALTPARVA